MAPSEQTPPENQPNQSRDHLPGDITSDADARLWEDAGHDRILYGLFKSNEENEQERLHGQEEGREYNADGYLFSETRELLRQAIDRRRNELRENREEP